MTATADLSAAVSAVEVGHGASHVLQGPAHRPTFRSEELLPAPSKRLGVPKPNAAQTPAMSSVGGTIHTLKRNSTTSPSAIT